MDDCVVRWVRRRVDDGAGRMLRDCGAGIVDYDGWTISARQNGVSRNADKMLDGSCGYNKPEVTNGNAGNN